MLQRNMNTAATVRLGLDDVLGDLQHARRRGDLGRLALLVYCEVRRWARQAGEADVAQHSLALITENPHASRAEFLLRVDDLIQELEGVRHRMTAEPHSPSQA
ncbi:MAG TPA: hypothetical protein VLE45_11200 [Burkholderiaceae bacterium]|nr:hypothetical protein [Burkholderiaceae bacterium]